MEAMSILGFVFGLTGLSGGTIALTAVKKLIKELKANDVLGEDYKM